MRNATHRLARFALASGMALALVAGNASAEAFIDLGLNASRLGVKVANRQSRITTNTTGLHLGVGARRDLAKGGNIGVRLEVDDVDSNLLLAIRALDYRFNLSHRLAITAFAGAARLDLATPAYGYYFGGGVQFKDLRPHWDLSVDLRYGDKIARDNLLSTDPQGGSPDNFYDLVGFGVYLSRRF